MPFRSKSLVHIPICCCKHKVWIYRPVLLLYMSMELDVSHDEEHINLGCVRTVCQREYVEVTGGWRNLAVCNSCQMLWECPNFDAERSFMHQTENKLIRDSGNENLEETDKLKSLDIIWWQYWSGYLRNMKGVHAGCMCCMRETTGVFLWMW
jgi:hypothetical protein